MPGSQIPLHLLQEYIHLDKRHFLALELRWRLRLRLDGGYGGTPGAHRLGGGFPDKVAGKAAAKGILVSHTTLGDIRFDRDIRPIKRRRNGDIRLRERCIRSERRASRHLRPDRRERGPAVATGWIVVAVAI